MPDERRAATCDANARGCVRACVCDRYGLFCVVRALDVACMSRLFPSVRGSNWATKKRKTWSFKATTHGLEGARAFRGAGTSQRIRGPYLRVAQGSGKEDTDKPYWTHRSNSYARSRARVVGWKPLTNKIRGILTDKCTARCCGRRGRKQRLSRKFGAGRITFCLRLFIASSLL